MSGIAVRVVACVCLWWKGWVWLSNKKKLGSKPLTERHLPQVYLSHTTFPSLLSSSLSFLPSNPLSPCFEHAQQKEKSNPDTSLSALPPLSGKVEAVLCFCPQHCLYCISIRLVYSQPGTVQAHGVAGLMLVCWGPICHQYTTAQSADDSFSLMSLSEIRREARGIK